MFIETIYGANKKYAFVIKIAQVEIFKKGKEEHKMTETKKSLKRKLAEAGGWKVARRVAKSVPYVGTVMTIGLIGYDIRRKGVVGGVLNSGLDAIPFVGLAKNAVEFFTGDIFPDKPAANANKLPTNGEVKSKK